jgi:hypothetical protein
VLANQVNNPVCDEQQEGRTDYSSKRQPEVVLRRNQSNENKLANKGSDNAGNKVDVCP